MSSLVPDFYYSLDVFYGSCCYGNPFYYCEMTWLKESKTCPTSATDLWNVLLEQWIKITCTDLEKLLNRIIRIVEVVLDTRGFVYFNLTSVSDDI